ncbi:hypothetical protein RHMOL_Rhmol01G0147700 [Rhododendron molle]|uniref:Uncharacterized protein n=1 Tax=Rhododendron molle TaxID=49168 RepID=A0ACC0Q1G6_RHOML|nr:hypothetical protein RHMOL_Rhmol01G0147700 [Rhododendron molle]
MSGVRGMMGLAQLNKLAGGIEARESHLKRAQISPPGSRGQGRGRPTEGQGPRQYGSSGGMIVDDEYVILGSANINQRSMEGTKDTEIAMGAYQPHHTWAKKLRSPQGQIYGYRTSLWAEHLETIENCFMRPESLECVRKVRSMGEMNWQQFAADEVTEMRAHLLKYPVDVDRKGKVSPLPGCENSQMRVGASLDHFLPFKKI